MKCYICGENLGEDIGWDFCSMCRAYWDRMTVVEAIKDGILIVVVNEKGHLSFVPMIIQKVKGF